MRIAGAVVSTALALALAAGAPTHAATASIGTLVVAARAPHPMALDPTLRDPAWAKGRIQPDGFWNLTKRDAAPFSTRIYLLYDDRNLYVGFASEQTGTPIVAGQTTNNLGFGLDDFVGVAVDTSGAGHQVYYFETTPRAVRYQSASENARYTPRWQSAAFTDGQRWNAVLVMPLRVMRVGPGKRQTWKVNFIRSVAARGEHFTWAYNGLMADGTIPQSWPVFADAQYWPTMVLGDLGASRALSHAEVYALGSAGSDRNEFEQANGTFGPQKVRNLGVDITIPITNTINAVGTINPDFSNVEVDQITIAPQEFQRALVEYRPFFAQGASFISPSSIGFSTPTGPNNQLFYSPRIGPFDSGAKVEGSFGLQSFGILTFHGYDETTGNAFDDIAYGYKHATPDNSFAYWWDGVIADHSIAGNDTTTEGGFRVRDLKSGLEAGTQQTIEQGSWVPYTGFARSSLQYVALNKPNYFGAFGYNDLTPNYNPIDGLTFNSDIRGFQGGAGASGSTSWAKNYAFNFFWDRWFDDSGAIHESDTLAMMTATFDNGLSIDNLGPSVGILRTYDVFAGSKCSGPVIGTSSYTGYPCYAGGYDQRFNLFTAALGWKDGTPAPIDASYAFGPFGDNSTQLFTMSTSRPAGRFSLSLEYDGTFERAFATGVLNSQFLRRVSLGRSLGPESNVSVSLQSINGLGGFAPQTGTNAAIAYHQRFVTGNELFVDYGTPAAYSTLHRFIVKYIFHAGGDAGT